MTADPLDLGAWVKCTVLDKRKRKKRKEKKRERERKCPPLSGQSWSNEKLSGQEIANLRTGSGPT